MGGRGLITHFCFNGAFFKREGTHSRKAVNVCISRLCILSYRTTTLTFNYSNLVGTSFMDLILKLIDYEGVSVIVN